MNPASILALSPFESPDPGLVTAAHRAGAIGVLELGRDEAAWQSFFEALAGAPRELFGVRIAEGVDVLPEMLPANASLVILPTAAGLARWKPRRVFVQVTSLSEALEAEAAGADAIIAKGFESGGRIGEETTFVLLQHLVGRVSIPIWVQGGIGLYTAAACIVAGASGVVLDAQLGLLRESNLPEKVKAAIRSMDGSETTIVDGQRVYSRPGLALQDSAAQALKVGADAAFAKPMADAYQTVGGLVRALCAQVERQLRSARGRNHLSSESKFAASFGLRYPIAQGPMTRVSDVAPFARAVSDGGALPFLALALMRGPEIRKLLTECAEKLEGRTWGVGVLGFVPPELREEQLDVIRDFDPPVVLIAGGRPSQAKPLEDAGIRTFLHVPSPGLLDLFLSQGARRFVFEGLECGGHVGPRSSFVLWETQMQRLMRHEKPEELSVLFAGGIHDALSAAMVAAITAPLAERGAEVGVLMGTAYIFTKEAVDSGAIRQGFQEGALACDTTVLLETAPGHATRCAETDYVTTFKKERDRMLQEKVPAEEMWASLETLNLGRLRIASKGLNRQGDAIVEVDAETQRREGMIMIGEVAALRDRVSTIADLHRDVSEGAAAVLAKTETDLEQKGAPASKDIAIVGMAAIMPGAPDLESFWANIVGGVNSIREVSPERWKPELYFDPESMNGEKTPSKWGGFLDPVAFDPLKYGIPPLSLAAIEPVQLLALEVSHRALKHAGYLERDFDRQHTSVIFGAEAGTDLAGAYGFRAMWKQYAGEMPPELAAALPYMTEDSFPGILANVIAGRVANRLDLGGSNFTVDAACASSLAAVDLGCKELLAGTSEMVICGGADLHNSIVDYLAFASVHALSPTGQSRTFDAAGDGITLGEGVAAVILKRLEDAERDGDQIYAVIKGVGSSSDGRSLGLTAPRPEGEERALERAYERAGVSPADIGLIEAHGTGTVVGDRTELETLNTVFRRAGAVSGATTLGSVKSQIGHTKCAAGLAGLIKSTLALHRRVLPPTLNIEEPNAAWSPDSPFSLNTVARPWPQSMRNAGVSAFGFGGTNFHVVLSEYNPQQAESGLAEWPSELFLFRGETLEKALTGVETLDVVLAKGELWHLRDLALTVSRSGKGPVQLAIVANDLDDLTRKLIAAKQGSTSDGVFRRNPAIEAEPRVAFLFPGQGSQRVGMLGDLFIAFPELQEILEAAPEIAGRIFPPTPWTEAERAAQKEALTDTRAAQPALGATGLAMAKLLQRFGVQPDMLGGHSYGELIALTVGGVLPEESLLALSEARASSILEATAAGGGDPGAMAAVSADAKTVAKHIAGLKGVVIANENSPVQTVISGETAAVAQAVKQIKDAGVGVVPLQVACAFHSPLVAPASKIFRAHVDEVRISPAALTVYSNTTAEPYPATEEAIRARLAEHIAKPVLFASQIEAMYEAGARIFVESGAGKVLTGLVTRTLGDRPHLAIVCDQNGSNGVTQLLKALGQLAVNGINIDSEVLFKGRGAQVCDFTASSPLHPTALSWWVNGQRAWPVRGEPPAYALRPIMEPVVNVETPRSHSAAADQTPQAMVVLDYMKTMRESMDSMSRVVAGYLGQEVVPPQSPVFTLAAMETGLLPSGDPPTLEPPAPAPEPEMALVAAPVQPAVVPIEELLLHIVSERTGYPLDMLDLELDLEADLSIDSIKRVEILGTLTLRLGINAEEAIEELPDDLVRLKTLRGIIDAFNAWSEGRDLMPQPATVMEAAIIETLALPSPAARAPEASPPIAVPATPAAPAATPVVRYLPAWSPTARLSSIEGGLAGLTVSVVAVEGPLAVATASKLKAAGARIGDVPAKADVLVELRPLADNWSASALPALFSDLSEALAGEVRTVLIATKLGELLTQGANGHAVPPGAGIAGMVKSYAKERTDCNFRVVNLPDDIGPDDLAGLLCSELSTIDDVVEVSYFGGSRYLGRVRREDLYTGGTKQQHLDAPRTVLITGGARGITAEVAIALATRYKCHLDLVGRTKPVDRELFAHVDEDAELPAIRQQLIAGGLREPAAIEAAASSLIASREIAATLRAIREAGGTADYHAIDVRDASQFGGLIDKLYERHGHIDGVIHGAGVIEDGLAHSKSIESFSRVFDTKVNGALILAEKLRDDVSFMVFFGSVSGAFGNRGQTDYAAANDFLDKLASSLNSRRAGRVLSVDWGPWSGAGMVSPGLANEYSRRGYGLIDPARGVESLISELLYGPKEDAHVILTATPPSKLA